MTEIESKVVATFYEGSIDDELGREIGSVYYDLFYPPWKSVVGIPWTFESVDHYLFRRDKTQQFLFRLFIRALRVLRRLHIYRPYSSRRR